MGGFIYLFVGSLSNFFNYDSINRLKKKLISICTISRCRLKLIEAAEIGFFSCDIVTCTNPRQLVSEFKPH